MHRLFRKVTAEPMSALALSLAPGLAGIYSSLNENAESYGLGCGNSSSCIVVVLVRVDNRGRLKKSIIRTRLAIEEAKWSKPSTMR